MPEQQERAKEASARFRYRAAQAEHYDRYRPPYPANVFTTLIREAHLVEGDLAIEIGAGTGLATRPLVESGLMVHAVEPAVELVTLAAEKLEGRAVFSFEVAPPNEIWPVLRVGILDNFDQQPRPVPLGLNVVATLALAERTKTLRTGHPCNGPAIRAQVPHHRLLEICS